MDLILSLVEAERLLELESDPGDNDVSATKGGGNNLDSSMEDVNVVVSDPPASSIGGLEGCSVVRLLRSL